VRPREAQLALTFFFAADRCDWRNRAKGVEVVADIPQMGGCRLDRCRRRIIGRWSDFAVTRFARNQETDCANDRKSDDNFAECEGRRDRRVV
jgi:hypothetical protein